MIKKPQYLVFFILISLLAGLIGSFFTVQSVAEWYPSLAKPWFSPPSWVFGPVWTILYVLMGISAYLVHISGDIRAKKALPFFSLQLVLNALWSVAFFGSRSPLLGFIVIVFLWIAILITMLRFNEISEKSALLLAPYILWVTFAAFLNLSIVLLNPGI